MLVGHSSGAHNTAIVSQVDAAVLQGGVYDPLARYCQERTRDLETNGNRSGHAGYIVDDIIAVFYPLLEKKRYRMHYFFDPRERNLALPCSQIATIWLQQILRCLLDVDPRAALDDLSPWIDHRKTTDSDILHLCGDTPTTTRRFLKTHLPRDALPISSDTGCYVYIARWSFYNHHGSYTPENVARMNEGWDGESFPDFVAEGLGEGVFPAVAP